jgi:hypothetical protein
VQCLVEDVFDIHVKSSCRDLIFRFYVAFSEHGYLFFSSRRILPRPLSSLIIQSSLLFLILVDLIKTPTLIKFVCWSMFIDLPCCKCKQIATSISPFQCLRHVTSSMTGSAMHDIRWPASTIYFIYKHIGQWSGICLINLNFNICMQPLNFMNSVAPTQGSFLCYCNPKKIVLISSMFFYCA